MNPEPEAPGPCPAMVRDGRAGAPQRGAWPSGTCVLPNALQEQGVLGQTLHLRGDHVLQLQAAAPRAALGLLGAEWR